MKRRRWRRVVDLLLAFSICMIVVCSEAESVVSNNRWRLLEQSIVTRALGIEVPSQIGGLLATMPAGLSFRGVKPTREILWSLFFSGSMTKLARVDSLQPFIVFYNPIADVAFIQGCNSNHVTGLMTCAQACAIPGEILIGATYPDRTSSWRFSSDPIEAMQRVAGERMRALAAAHPSSSPEVFPWQSTWCTAEYQQGAEKRLIALAKSFGEFNEGQFRAAAGHYVAQAMRTSAEQQGGPLKGTADSVIAVLEHLNDMRMSGAIALTTGGWLVFLSDKRSGWHIAVFKASSGLDNTLKIDSARLLSISTMRGRS